MSHLRPTVVLCVLCLLVMASEGAAQSSSSARVILDGRALDVATGEPLAGARVLVNDGPVESSTNRDGTFRIVAPSSGSLTLKITYLGRPDCATSLQRDRNRTPSRC